MTFIQLFSAILLGVAAWLPAVEPMFLGNPAPFPLGDGRGGLAHMLAYDGRCHLGANGGSGEAWMTVGETPESLQTVAGAALGLQNFMVFRGTVYGVKLDLFDDEGKSFNLYRYDAASNSAEHVLRWELPVQDESSLMRVVVVGDHLYALFFYRVLSTVVGYQLIRSDGTQSGTQEIHSVPRDRPLGPGLAATDTHLFFTSKPQNSEDHGTEPYAIAAADPFAEPVLLGDLFPGNRGSGVDFSDARVIGNQVFFIASTAFSGQKLFVSDGTPAGTKRVPGVPDEGFPPTSLMAAGDELWFEAHHPDLGYEAYRTDGTTTHLVKDINPGSASARISTMYHYGDHVYLVATDGQHGAEIWRSDGTPAGTTRITDLIPGSAGLPDVEGDRMIGVGEHLVIIADDGEGIWTCGLAGQNPTRLGTIESREQGADHPLAGTIHPQLVETRGRAYFPASQPADDHAELWMVDFDVPGTIGSLGDNPGLRGTPDANGLDNDRDNPTADERTLLLRVTPAPDSELTPIFDAPDSSFDRPEPESLRILWGDPGRDVSVGFQLNSVSADG